MLPRMSFTKVFAVIWETFQVEWRTKGPTGDLFADFYRDIGKYLQLKMQDLLNILLIASLLTILRGTVTRQVLQPLAQKLQFRKKDLSVFPESAFKCFMYLVFFAIECVLLFSFYPEFLTDPASPWRGWHTGWKVSPDIYWLYMNEAAFYVHGIYGIFFMDMWRDDSIMMVLHHTLTISLIVFSVGVRYHKIGLVVLFLHDIADIFLEFAKIMKCFQNRMNQRKKIYRYFVNAGFLAFAFSWVLCRIYLYPILVLFSTGHAGIQLYPNAPFYLFFNVLLWILYCMNIYWLCFIVLLLYRAVTNKSTGIEDPREKSIEEYDAASKAHAVDGNLKCSDSKQRDLDLVNENIMRSRVCRKS